MTEDQLSALLRTLHRHEQPPEGYVDQLIRNVHRRQREAVLQPLWKIAAERIHTFFGHHSMSPLAYAGAMMLVLSAGLALIGNLPPSAPVAAQLSATNAIPAKPAFGQPPLQGQQVSTRPELKRFVIDERPVTSERSTLSF